MLYFEFFKNKLVKYKQRISCFIVVITSNRIKGELNGDGEEWSDFRLRKQIRLLAVLMGWKRQ